jgi:hypothetical protein
MSRRCGISTVLGALLFTMVALLFIALVLRTFSESSATLTEVASVAVQNNVEERLAISILYKQVRKLTASEASASVIVRTGSGSVDASLLDALNDGRFASIESAPVNAINSTGSQVTVAHAVELEVNSAVSGNCTITVAANSTVFIEIYVPAGQAWVLASKYYANTPYAWFNVTFSGSRALLYAYSTRPFKLMIDYLEVSTFELAPDVAVTVANEGAQPVNLYAVWLNGWRVDARRVLSPGAQLTVTFTGVQYDNLSGFEVRAVTSTRVHAVRFYIERAPTPQPVPRFRITSYTSVVSGPAGSRQVFEATVANIGSAAGNATVEVFDHNDNLIGKVNLSLQPGESITVRIGITLPSASGTYTWTVSVRNALTGSTDDSEAFTVVATAPSPTFQIVSWNQSIVGPVGSKQRFVAVIQNTGSGAGTVEVRVLDSAGALVNSTQTTVQAGSQATAALTITLPSTMGTYTWSVVAVNNATGSVDDSKSFTVIAQQPLFTITSWNQSVAGPVGSKQKFTATIKNAGNGEGTVRVEVRDHNNALVNSTTLTLPAGGQSTIALTITLPSARGTYTWSVIAVNIASGSVDDTKSFTVYAMDLYLKARSALTFTGFESLPSGWSSIGGSWSIASGGVEGNALQGSDNNGGPGGTSVYYWSGNVAAYTSLQAVVQVRITSVDSVYRGIVLLQGTSSTSWLYEVSVRPRRVGVNDRITVYIRRWVGGWTTPTSKTVSYASGWYTLYVSWSRSGTTNTISATLYDSNGNPVTTVSASDSQVSVNYFGLDVDGGTSLFDNFVLATGDPRYVVVSGLQQGWTVELRDASGALVASATADSSGTARLFVAARPIVANAKVTVKDAQGVVVIERTFSQVVGGDEYAYGP